MADIGQLETALQNAHAAGDTEAATILASEIVKSRKTSGPVTLGDIGASAWNDIKKAGSNIAHSIYSGVTLAGDAASGKAQLPSSQGVPGSVPFGDPNSAGLRVADMATLAAPVNPAIRAGDRAIPGVAKAVVGEKVAPSAEQLVNEADKNYGRARSSGVEFSPDYVKNSASGIAQELEQGGYINAPKVASGTHDILRRLQEGPSGSSVTMANIDAARRSLRSIAQNYAPDAGADRAAASIAIERLDALPKAAGPQDFVAGGIAAPYAVEQIEKGRGNVAAAKRSNVLTGELDTAHTGILEQAADRTAAANSGQNTGNPLRSRIASLLANKKQLGGWNEQEIAQADLANKGTFPMNSSRWVGNFMGGGGGLGAQITSALSAGIGAAAAGIPGAAAGATVGPILGASAKQIEGALTKRQINKLDEMLRKRSPAYEDAPTNYTPISPEKRAAIVRALMLEQQ